MLVYYKTYLLHFAWPVSRSSPTAAPVLPQPESANFIQLQPPIYCCFIAIAISIAVAIAAHPQNTSSSKHVLKVKLPRHWLTLLIHSFSLTLRRTLASIQNKSPCIVSTRHQASACLPNHSALFFHFVSSSNQRVQTAVYNKPVRNGSQQHV